MSRREHIYHTYRVMVALHNQVSMFEDSYTGMKETEVRHSIYEKVYDELVNSTRLRIHTDRKDYYLFVSRELRKGVLLCKLAKEEVLKWYPLSDEDVYKHDIKEVVLENYPYVHIIIHLDQQAFLIEKNTTKFHDTDQCARIMEQLFFDMMMKHNATLKVYPLTAKGWFWETYKIMETVTKLEMTINSPNFLGGRFRAEEILQDIKDETNAQTTEMKFENRESGLKIKEHDDSELGVGKFLNYIRNGAGKWTLFGKIKGKEAKVSSGSNKTVVCLPANIEEGEGVLEKIESAVEVKEGEEE